MTPQRIDKTTSTKLSFFAFISAVMVVLIHAPTAANAGISTYVEVMLSDRLCQIAVPFFFAASGYLIAGHINEHGWWWRVASKRLHTILVPYLFWCVIYAFVYWMDALCRGKPFGVHQIINGFGLVPTGAPFSPLWYLRELLILLLPLPIFVWILGRGRWLGGVFLGLLFAGLQFTLWRVDEDPSLEMFLLYFVSFRAMVYFCAGIWLRLYPIAVRSSVAWALLIFGIFLMVFERRLGCGVLPLRNFVSSVAIALTLSGAWGVVPPMPLPKILVGMAFPIYLIHRIFIMSAVLVLDHYASVDYRGLGGYALISVGAIVFSVGAGRLIMRRLPRVAHLAFGGRT